MGKLDLNKGCIIRFHPSGIQIGAYIDEPGTYYTQAGDVIDPKLAQAAGFDIQRDAQEKLKNARIAEFRVKLEAELTTEEDALATALSANGKYDVRHVGGDQYALFGTDGARVTPGTMTKTEIELLIGAEVPSTQAEATT